jgi:putative tricarboxylic transport membrane protein
MVAIWEALGELLTIHHFLYLWLGVIIGMIVGILPGMGGTAGMALLLPFVYGMDQTSALALMIGMLATTATGDTFPSILMGIPGGSSSATVIDGFPLARQGHAARALAASFSASLLGGLLGSLVLTACVFIARPLILGVGMGEQLLLIVLALTMVGSLTGRSPLKGLAGCGLGLLIGTIGSAPATGELRYTLDTVYLSDGIPLIVLALGIFAMPEIVDLMRQRSTIANVESLGSGWRDGIADTLREWWLVVRVSGIGAIIGVLPGVGASTADWLAYGHVVQSSRDKSKFGKGDIRGVIAPEAANNAVRGGDLVPTLFFGIPGSGSMALLLGAFILIGLEPGAKMVGADLDLTFVIIWSLALANVFGAIICIVLAGPIAQLTLIRYAFLAPLITVLMFFTAYQATLSWGDVLALVLLSVFGLYMKRFDWSRPALVVGFVLSHGLEASSYQTAQVYGFSFLQRPQAILIALMVLASIAAGVWMVIKNKSAEQDADAETEKPVTRLPQIAFTAAIIAAVVAALYSSWDSAYLTRLFPMAAGGITLLLLGATLLQQILAAPSNPVLADFDQTNRKLYSGQPSKYVYLGWFVLFLALIWVLGFTIASAIFVTAFITVECGRPIWRNVAFGIGTVLVLTALAYILYLEYPDGFLPEYLSFPWWLH